MVMSKNLRMKISQIKNQKKIRFKTSNHLSKTNRKSPNRLQI